jgi:hypothetical protein
MEFFQGISPFFYEPTIISSGLIKLAILNCEENQLIAARGREHLQGGLFLLAALQSECQQNQQNGNATDG